MPEFGALKMYGNRSVAAWMSIKFRCLSGPRSSRPLKPLTGNT